MFEWSAVNQGPRRPLSRRRQVGREPGRGTMAAGTSLRGDLGCRFPGERGGKGAGGGEEGLLLLLLSAREKEQNS